MTTPDGVIFDFDGVIVDTEPLHWKAFKQMLEPKGLELGWDVYLDRYLGFDDRDVFREAYKDIGLELREVDLPGLIEEKARVFEALAQEDVPSSYPGAVALIRSLSGRIPLAICSGALRSDIEPILESLGIGSAFDVMVTADEVQTSKPDPESYALAVKRLAERFPEKKIVPSHCVAIEDTPAGIAAARGAGLTVLAVANTYPPEALKDASRILDSLKDITPEVFGEM